MKRKQTLLLTVLAMVIQGCGESAEKNLIKDPPQETEENNIILKDARQKKQALEKYLFDDTLEYRNGNHLFAGGFEVYKGIVSEPFKATIRKLWSKLEEKGFSGFDPKVISEGVHYKFEYISLHTSRGNAKLSLPLQPAQLAFNITLDRLCYGHTDYNLDYREYLLGMKPFPVLLGLKFNNKALTLVRPANGAYEVVLADEFRQDPSGKNNVEYIPSKIDSDVPVTQAQIDEWNQVFIDALKEDPFFGKEMSAPTDSSGNTSALSALKGKSGMDATSLMVNGISGSTVDLGLPMYVQLKGSIDHNKSTDGMTGLVAYKLGNSVLGVIQSYANSGTGFNTDSRQLESSIIAAHSFGLVFVEGQFGSVSASDVNFKDWSGLRSQVRFGVDTPFGAPLYS